MKMLRGIVAAIGVLLVVGATGNVDREIESAFYAIPFVPTPAWTIFGIGITGIALLYWGARPFFTKKST